jgi:hypothetical protein
MSCISCGLSISLDNTPDPSIHPDRHQLSTRLKVAQELLLPSTPSSLCEDCGLELSMALERRLEAAKMELEQYKGFNKIKRHSFGGENKENVEELKERYTRLKNN